VVNLIKRKYLQKIYVDEKLLCISDNFDIIDFKHYFEIKEAIVGEYLERLRCDIKENIKT